MEKSSVAILPKTETYTISHFRVKIYSLLHKVADGKLMIDLTMSRPHQAQNSDVIVINKNQYEHLVQETHLLEQENRKLRDED